MQIFYTEKNFIRAVWQSDIALVSKYLARKDKDRWLALRQSNGHTPLHLAAKRDDANMLQLLIKAGAPLDAADSYGNTALALTMQTDYSHRREPMVRILLEAGADPNVPKEGYHNPLYYATYKEDIASVKMLLAAKADPGVPGLLDMALQRNANISILLINAGATLENASNFVHRAASLGSVELLALLTEKGGDLSALNAGGQSLLHVAAAAGMTEMVKTLLAEGLDINQQDYASQTPLHLAAQAESAGVVSILLAQGAKTGIEDHQKMTALALARVKNNAPIIHMLEAFEKETLSKAATPLTATVNMMPSSSAETWVLMGDHQVARVGVYPELARKLTEIFNFESRERIVVSENLKTGAENLAPFTPFDALDGALLQKAFNAFRQQGGKGYDDVVSAKQLSKKPAPGLEARGG